MISIKKLLNIVCTEAIESSWGESGDNHFDEGLNMSYQPSLMPETHNLNLPSFRFDLKLIEAPDGSLYWAE
jgi:hypothetical protein